VHDCKQTTGYCVAMNVSSRMPASVEFSIKLVVCNECLASGSYRLYIALRLRQCVRGCQSAAQQQHV
jgi:hypothetical protein